MHIKKRYFFGIAAAAAAAMLLYSLYVRGWFLPSWVSRNEKEIVMDLDGDGRSENIVLKSRHLSVNGVQVTDSLWTVTDVFADDIDQDGTADLLLLVWNRTDFGDHHPFWQEKDTGHFYQHLYIFTYTENRLKPKWMSSALHPNIQEMKISPEHTLLIKDPQGEDSEWAWRGWGIERIDIPGITY